MSSYQEMLKAIVVRLAKERDEINAKLEEVTAGPSERGQAHATLIGCTKP